MKKTRGSTGNYNPQMGYNIKSAIIFYEALPCHDVVQISIHANMDNRNVFMDISVIALCLEVRKYVSFPSLITSPCQFSMWILVLVY